MNTPCLPRMPAGALPRPGWPAIAGAGLLLLCVAVYAIGIAPASQRLEELHQRATVLRQPRVAPAAPVSIAPAEQLARFRDLFVADREALPLTAKVIAAAQRHGLVARQASYRFEEDKDLKLTRMHVALPLKGDYVAIRRFLAEVRRDIPALALEQVHFERRAVGDRAVEARITLRIYLGRP